MAWSVDGKGGAQLKFSDLAIATALTLRVVFHLPLRQTEGFVRSLFALMDVELDVPDRTTLSRRAKQLRVDLRRVRHEEPVHLVIDSSGLSIVGEGEWSAAKHGGSGRRGWKKLHLGVDANGEILAQVLTDSLGDDATSSLDLKRPRVTPSRHAGSSFCTCSVCRLGLIRGG